MTRERREEVILIALAVSALAHVGIMAYAKPRVMTHVAAGVARFASRAPMRVTKTMARPEPAKLASVEDLQPVRDAPSAAPPATEVPVATAVPTAPDIRATLAEPVLPDAPAPAAPVFDIAPVRLDEVVSAKLPMLPIETPTASAVPLPSAAALPGPSARPPTLPTVGRDPDSVFLPSELQAPPPAVAPVAVAKKPAPPPRPAAEVFGKVDERIVSEEKRAVRELVDAGDAAELKPCVDVTLTAAVQGSWRYFRVRIRPRKILPVVPKDVVVLIDASGSIGSDRIVSVRKAAKRILRTVANSDDRFNLVAFRDRFSYAFRAWQDCTQTAFDRADAWLNDVAAHGRTDVFSTIRSVLTLPRDPTRPLIALVVTDGDANAGVSGTAEILSKFTALNDGLVSVYMYGVKSSANRELIDVLTHGNRGESLIFDGWRWNAGEGLETLAARFRDPVLSDLRVVFGVETPAEAYPRILRNLHRDDAVDLVGRVPARTREVCFSLKGLNGADAYESFFRLPLDGAAEDPSVVVAWKEERSIDERLREEGGKP